MATQLAGEAYVRIVPSLKNFRSRVQNELSRKPMRFDIDVRPKVDTSLAEAQLEKFRAKEHADAINLRARVDTSQAKRAFSQVEHIFKRSAVYRAMRLNIVVLGGDAIYSAAAALGSLSAAVDVAAKSLVALPGLFSSAGAAAGVFAAAMSGLKAAFKAVADDQKNAAQNARDLDKASRDSARAHRDVGRAVGKLSDAYRDARREVEDLHHEVRRGSLDEADAILNLQESLDTLRQGGFKSLMDFRRAQLGVLQSWDDLQQTQVKNKRNLDDFNQAQREGINQNDKVVSALDQVAAAQDRVADAADRMAKANTSKSDSAFGKLAPEAQDFVRTVTDAAGVWQTFKRELQGNVFSGQSQNFLDTLNVSMANLAPGLRNVASSIGGVFKELGATLRSDKNQNSMKGIIGNTKTGLDTLTRAIDPLLSGFLRISNSTAFPALMGWIGKLSERWDAWTDRINKSGELDKWVQDGIKALNSLVNTGSNLLQFIGSVADAWRVAGGASAGVFDSAESLTKTLADWADSNKGQNSMITYFKEVRAFVDKVADAFKNMGPLVSHISDFVREWSAAMLTVLGGAAKLTAWVEDHTGLVKYLLWTYLSFRTIAPLWALLSTAAGNYSRTVQNLGKAHVPVFTGMTNGLNSARGAWSSMNGVVAGASSTFSTNAAKANTLTTATRNLFAPVNNLSGAFKTAAGQTTFFANQAGFAATQVGGGRAGIGAGLMGAVGGLARFLGPTAGFMVALAAGAWAVNKLGEAHRNAAKDADTQRNALDQLKQSLDNVSGAATAATALETAKKAQGYTIPNFPGGTTRNVLEDFARAGLGDPRQLINATNPTQQGARDNLLNRIDSDTKAKIEQSDVWARGKELWEKHGVTSEILAKAANGDPASVAKINQAEQAMGAGKWDRFGQSLHRKAGDLTPSLTEVISGAGTFDLSSSGIFLRNVSGALVQGGQAAQAANAAAAGRVGFKPGMSLGGPNSRVYTDGTTTKVETSDPVAPGWAEGVPSEIGQGVILPDGRGQITLSPEAALKYTQGFATGGLIRGKGSGTSDSNVIRASMGEFIIKKSSVDKYGVDHLNAINSGQMPRFDGGGGVGNIFAGPYAPPKPNPFAGVQASGSAQLPPPPKPSGVTLPLTPGAQAAKNAADSFGTPKRLPDTGNTYKFRGPSGWRGPSIRPGVKSAITNLILGPDPAGPTGRVGPAAVPPEWQNATGLWNQMGLPAPKPPVQPKPNKPNPVAPPASKGAGAKPANPVAAGTAKYVPGKGLVNNDGTIHGAGAPHLTGATPGPHGQGGPPGPVAGPGNFAPSPYTAGAYNAPQGGYQVPGMASSYAVPSAPGRFNESGLQRNTVRTLRALEQAFPQINDIGGYRQDALKWHPEGLALDVMIPGQGGLNDPTTPEGKVLGDQVWAWAQQNADALGIDMSASIWQKKDHYNHVHLATTGGGYPDAGEQLDIPGFPAGLNPLLAQSGVSGIPGLGGMNLAGLSGIPGLGGSGQMDMGSWLENKYREAYKSENILDFLGGQMQNVGQNLSQIGFSFLQGLTGLDLSGIAGTGTGALSEFFGSGKDSKDSQTGLGDSGLDPLVTGDLSQYMGGMGALSPDIAGLFGSSTPTKSYGQGVDQWDQTIQGVLMQLAAQGLIDQSEIPAWMDAVKRQMKLESNGDPSAINNWDSNAAKGTPSKGLMQTIDSTFASFVPDGFSNDVWDPASNIAAAIMYAKSKGGPSAMNGQTGYAVGGKTPKGGPIRVSRGEFRMNPKAVAKHGMGFMAALNAGTLPGFEGGGLPFLTNQPPPPPPPPPAPAPGTPAPGAPAPASGPGVPPPPAGPGAQQNGPVAPPPDPNAPMPTGEIDPAAQAAAEAAARGLGAVGAAPTTNDHLSPGIKGAIQGGFNAAGAAAATAAQMGMMAGTMGAAGPASGAASSAISGGFQIAGMVASGLANVLASAGVGSIKDVGTQGNPSGTPLLPSGQPMSFGLLPTQDQLAQQNQPPAGQGQGPVIMNVYNGGIHTSNMDEYQRRQQRLMDQQAQPYINKYPTI